MNIFEEIVDLMLQIELSLKGEGFTLILTINGF